MRHVLVVDDEPAICELVQTGLKLDGTCRVSRASNATEARATVLRDRPDVAIIDAVLPIQSGLVLAREVVDLGIPVLLITGEPGHQQHLVDADCSFLRKPFSIWSLIAETRLLLEEATQRMAQLAANLDRLARTKRELAQAIEESRRLLERARADRAARLKSTE